MDTTLQERIEQISPMLRKFAAHHTSTAYSNDLADMAPEAQDLYQIAVSEILANCKPEDKKSFMLNLANWRMSSAANRERNISYWLDDSETEDENGEVLDALEIFVDETQNPETVLIEHEAASRLQAIVRSLKPIQETIIRLMRDGETIMEIAVKLDMSHQAVRYHVEKIRIEFEVAGLAPGMAMA